ncbi:MAG: hypothetical protein QOE79_179 [Sphingomonadales bacterium]|nr:hypothetical protein [Sphingomonadales bacterium]
MIRMCWSEIASPGRDLGLPGVVQGSNTLPMRFAHREDGCATYRLRFAAAGSGLATFASTIRAVCRPIASPASFEKR